MNIISPNVDSKSSSEFPNINRLSQYWTTFIIVVYSCILIIHKVFTWNKDRVKGFSQGRDKRS